MTGVQTCALPILAIAYLLLCGMGLLAQRQFRPSAWCSSNRQGECSIYTIGLIMLQKIKVKPPQAFTAILELSELAAPNWGSGRNHMLPHNCQNLRFGGKLLRCDQR